MFGSVRRLFSDRSLFMTTVAAAGLLLAAVACSKPPAAVPPQPIVPEPPQVRLLGAGEAPLATLALRPEVGSERATRVTVTTKAEVLAGADVPMAQPPAVTAVVTARIDSVESDGATRWLFRFPEATVTEQEGLAPVVRPTMQRQTHALQGLTGSVTSEPSGVVRSYLLESGGESAGEQKRAAALRDAASGLMASMTLPYPTEPVGVGARWEIVTSTKRQGVTVRERAVARLVERTATGRVTVALETKLELVDGEEKGVAALEGTGSGQLVLDPATPLPIAGELTSTITTTWKGEDENGAGETATIRAEVRTVLGPVEG